MMLWLVGSTSQRTEAQGSSVFASCQFECVHFQEAVFLPPLYMPSLSFHWAGLSYEFSVDLEVYLGQTSLAGDER